MHEIRIDTNLGQIAVQTDLRGEGPPILFMHGIFLDRSLWFEAAEKLPDVSRVYIDMPAHGESSDVEQDWSLDDCVSMLIEIVDALEFDRSYLVGQSWGSMTALRAAVRFPDRFAALALFNMPHRRTSAVHRLIFRMQQTLAIFPRFYGRQAAKSFYSSDLLARRPELSLAMQDHFARRSSKQLARVLGAAILNAEDATPYLERLRVPALAVIGEQDYVDAPAAIETMTVPGGHVSPHECAQEVAEIIIRVLGMGR